MIFITVGSTNFDPLVAAIDNWAREYSIKERVVAQIGNGQYSPRNIEYFDYTYELDTWFRRSDLVVCHGGTGTVFRLLHLNCAFVPVPNRDLQDDHQTDLLRTLESHGICRPCWDLNCIADAIQGPHCSKEYRLENDLSDVIWAEVSRQHYMA